MNVYTLSVIVPAYNCEKTLAQTLDSVLNQNSKDLEIILVNDGSIDRTDDICKEYSERFDNIKYFKKENSGVSDTRNIGLANATGKYIAFLDSDDVWDKNFYDDILNGQLKSEEYDVFAFASCFSDMDLNVVEVVNIKDQELIDKKDIAVDTFYHSFCSFCFKSSLISDNNIRFNSELRYGEDELFRSQCLYLAKKILAQNKMSFYYRNNVNSSTKANLKHKLYAQQKLKAYYLFKQFFFEQYKQNGIEQTIRNATTTIYLLKAINLLAETGYGYKKLTKIAEEENLNLIKENSTKIFRLHTMHLGTLDGFINSPLRFYIKHRFHGMWYYTALRFKHLLIRLKNRIL